MFVSQRKREATVALNRNGQFDNAGDSLLIFGHESFSPVVENHENMNQSFLFSHVDSVKDTSSIILSPSAIVQGQIVN